MYYVVYVIALCFQKRRIGIPILNSTYKATSYSFNFSLVLSSVCFLKSSSFGISFVVARFLSLPPFCQMDLQRPFLKLTPSNSKGFPLYARS